MINGRRRHRHRSSSELDLVNVLAVLERSLLDLAEFLRADVAADVDLDGSAHGNLAAEEEAVDAFER